MGGIDEQGPKTVCAWTDESRVHQTGDLDPGGWSGWQDIEVAPAIDDTAAEETGEGSDGEKDALPDQGECWALKIEAFEGWDDHCRLSWPCLT